MSLFLNRPPLPWRMPLELAETADQSGKTLMINFQRRFSLGVSRAKEIMAQESFGQLTQLFCSFCSGTYPTVQWYLLDFAIHHFDLAQYIAGPAKEIAVFHNEVGGQGSFAVAVEFENGAVGNLQLNSQRLWRRNYDRIEITGQGEYIVLDGLWEIAHYADSQNVFTDNYSDQRNGELTGDGYSLTEFVNAIRENREPIASINDCLKSMRLYEAVLEGRKGVITLND